MGWGRQRKSVSPAVPFFDKERIAWHTLSLDEEAKPRTWGELKKLVVR